MSSLPMAQCTGTSTLFDIPEVCGGFLSCGKHEGRDWRIVHCVDQSSVFVKAVPKEHERTDLYHWLEAGVSSGQTK